MSTQHEKAATNASTDRRHRRHARYRTEFPVGITLLEGQGYRHQAAHCKDLSEAGMGVLIAAELTLGEVVSLRFLLPGQNAEWNIRAVLRHRRGYHYGFEFLSLSVEERSVLLTYLNDKERADAFEP